MANRTPRWTGRAKGISSLLVGAAVLVVLLGGTAFGFASVQIGGQASPMMKIDFPSADGLVAGSDVLESGSRVGIIQSIEPTASDSALVTISVDGSHWPLHKGLTADIRPKSLLGEKYIDLHDGSADGPVYDTSVTLLAGQQAEPVELDQFINSLDPATRTAVRVLLDDLGAGVAGRGYDLNAAIAAGRADLANFAITGKTLNDRDPDLDKILVGLDGLLNRITTTEQLNQLSHLITNGQHVLNDIEQVQPQFSRQFTDANAVLADINVALDGAVPSLRATLDVGAVLTRNLSAETGLLGALACGNWRQGQTSVQVGASCPNGVTSTLDLSPGRACTKGLGGGGISNTTPFTLSGLVPCSPLWYLVKGLIQGPTVSGGGLETGNPNALDRGGDPIFRICLTNPNGASSDSCESSTASAAAFTGVGDTNSATFAALLGT